MKKVKKDPIFFLNFEKRNYEKKCIRKLVLNNQKEISEPQEILEEGKRFYTELYSNRQKSEKKLHEEYISKLNVPKLNDIDKKNCEVPLKIEEISQALSELENEKTTGCDCFTTNF